MDTKEDKKTSIYERSEKDALFDVAFVMRALSNFALVGMALFVLLLIVLMFTASGGSTQPSSLFGTGLSNLFKGIGLAFAVFLGPGCIIAIIVGIACVASCIRWFKGKNVDTPLGWVAAVGTIITAFAPVLFGATTLGKTSSNSSGILTGLFLEAINCASTIICFYCTLKKPVRNADEKSAKTTNGGTEIAAEVATHALGHEAPTTTEVKAEKDLPPMLNADPNAAGVPVGAVEHKMVTDAPVLAEGATRLSDVPEMASSEQQNVNQPQPTEEALGIKKL